MNVDPTICDELKQYKNRLFYLVDLYSKFDEVQKRLHGKKVTIIHAQTIILNFQSKMELFRFSLAHTI